MTFKRVIRVIVLEDVTTTGNSLIKAVKAVISNGGIVEKAYVIVDRDEGAIDNLKNGRSGFRTNCIGK